MKKSPLIGVSGNIGVGKTTFTEIVAERMGWKPYYESVADNPYLSDFYGNMKRWSFGVQIYFLHHRFRTHQQMSLTGTGAIQDRTIYEDVEIFARNLYEMGLMDERDWNNYRDLFGIMTSYLRKLDLIVYLKASTLTLTERIKNRARDYEWEIDPEYLHKLNILYDRWVNRVDDIPIITVETDNFNIFEDTHRLEEVIEMISNKLD